jgi:hypothetical protein
VGHHRDGARARQLKEADLSFEDAPGIVGVVEKSGPPYREFTFVDASACRSSRTRSGCSSPTSPDGRRRLNAFVYVPDKDGVPVGFGPADDVPDWAAAAHHQPRRVGVAELPTADPIERLGEAGATAEELEVIRSMLAALTDEERAEVGRHVVTPSLDVLGEQLDEWRRLSAGNGGDLVAAFEQLAAIQPPGQTSPPAPPPRAGAGSGRDAWADYARANEFDVAGDAKREDIIDALEAAGIPVE